MSRDLANELEPERKQLLGLAYRMLGSVAEAEDVVQDAYLRVRDVALDEVHNVGAYLSTTVARLCMDRLKSARAQREVYVGTWLPEPIVEVGGTSVDLAQDLSFALLMTLDRLSPPERTAFLLHDVFGYEHAQVAEVLQKSESACRKLAERARQAVRDGAPRFETKREDEERLFNAFMIASATGDTSSLLQLLESDAIMYQDSGGKRRAAHNPVFGADRIARFFAGVIKRKDFKPPQRVEPARVNQLPGCVLHFDDGDVAVAAIEIRAGKIARLYLINNPDKLQHLCP